MKEIRQKIDQIDRKISSLLDDRAGFVRKIGTLKKEKKEPVYAPERENEILESIRNLSSQSENGFPVDAKLNVFREIIAVSRILQKKLKISYLGPEATFTHMVAIKQFSGICDFSSASSIAQVFREVEKGRADYGVVPIENSTEGVVTHTLDMFSDSECKICSELFMEVSHHLLSCEDRLEDIKQVYSHPQALGQCELWLEENLPGVKLVEVSSTARAAQSASSGKNSAAIASSVAAKIYNLKIVARKIEDISENITRFLVIGNEISKPSDNSKTSIMFSVKDRVGVLHDMLVSFKTNSVNLTKIESRPSRMKAWEYIFFIDFKGHIDDSNVKNAIDELRKNCVFFKVLGSYPIAGPLIKDGN
jgi:chorismate mutase/prephenate dehydratase